MKVFLAGLVGLAILIVVALIGMRGVSMPTTTGSTEAIVSTMSVKESADAYEINIDYPQFGIAKIDEQIRNDIDDAVAEFKILPANPPESATPQNSFDGSYENVFIGPDVVSAKLILSQYTGGAHPMTILSGVNFSRETGERLELTDALAMIGKTVQQLSEEASAQLRTKFEDDFFAEGANTNPENFSSFYITADKVMFIFQPYQVAAYAAGPQEIGFARIK